MDQLFQSELLIITREQGGRIIRFRRTSRPAASESDHEKIISDCARIVPLAERGSLGLLLDLRDSPLLGDEGREASSMRVAHEVSRGFSRLSVLVRTAVGALQVRRFGRSIGVTADVFGAGDEAQAIAYLTSAVDAAPRQR